MKYFKNVSLIFLLAVFLILVLGNFCLAQEKPLEVEYPSVPGVETPTSVKTPLPDYVKYIFNFSLAIVSLIAFGALIYGGVLYLTSAGNPSKMGDARGRMFAGILGLIILLSAYLILTTINPRLIILKASLEPMSSAPGIPGIYLCKDSSMDVCVAYADTSSTISPKIEDEVNYVYFRNPPGITYGVVLHENENQQGKCSVCLSSGCNFSYVGGVSSITVFKQGGSSGEGVTLYEKSNYNEGCRPGKCDVWPVSGNVPDLDKKGRSIEIKGNYLAAIFEKTGYTGRCEVFIQSDPELSHNYIGVCGFWSNLGCFGSVRVLPITW